MFQRQPDQTNRVKTILGFWTSLLILGLADHRTAFAQNAPAPSSSKATSILLTVEGKVEAARAGVAQWSAAKTNQVLQTGDRVRTGSRSRATLRLSDLSILRVNELTTLEIRPPQQAGHKPQLDLKSGATYFFNREKPAEVQFRTPLASGAIRGTEFHLAVREDGRTVLTLLDGEVALRNEQGEIVLQSGEQGTVEAGRAPTKTAVLQAINIIQWALYYPAVIDADEVALTADEKNALSQSLQAYRSGDLLEALKSYPEDRQPASDPERIQRAALLLAAGQVEQTEAVLNSLPSGSPLVRALREVIAAVKNQPFAPTAEPSTASEWVARSYSLQSRSKLAEALKAAREAVKRSPNFGAAWVRVAELEFGFGRTSDALQALDKGLELSPRNAQGLALKGFLLSAQNKFSEALSYFDQAIAVDGGLGNAWLGRGLVKIRTGQGEEGRADLQVAATLEPQRAVLRSYLGKAFSYTKDTARAEKELALARKLDPNDPTSWLYSALLNQQENRINEAVAYLEKSQDLNDNRSVFRSRLLLDQDQAVRSANLASIYRDAGMTEVSVREASRAVNYDYGNYSAHLFLANSYNALRDPKLINLRYETPFFSELLVSQLLAPASGGNLSQSISQQEYSSMFDSDHLGLFSSTEYFSSGQWIQQGSQYGVLGNFGYSLDAFYNTDPGQRPNNDLEQLVLSASFKEQITRKDSVFFQAQYVKIKSGDVAQYYDQNLASRGLRVREVQEPNVLAGYHREWAPGLHTLFLAARFDDTLNLEDPAAQSLFLRQGGFIERFRSRPLALERENHLEAYSTELQQIWQTPAQTLVVGARYQFGWADSSASLSPTGGVQQSISSQAIDASLDRFSVYGYEQWQVLESLRLTAGVGYDRLYYPRNIDTAPITDKQATKDQVSPKAGFLWNPGKDTYLRGIYTRSLGGVFFDNSVRLEPTQVAGFNQAFRSLIPESSVGLVPGTRFETWGLGLDHNLGRGTYLSVEGEILKSDAARTVGVLSNTFFVVLIPTNGMLIPTPDTATGRRQSLDYEEKSFAVTLNQLIDQEWSVGAHYKLTRAELEARFTDVPPALAAALNQDVTATLHQLQLYANYNHPSGFFGQFQSIWSQQSNQGYTPDIPGDDFWQFNLYAGYRFLQRRAELRVGLLNIFDQDYRLNPLTLYNELPRERTLAMSFKFYF